jgi:hypothetical protein
MVDELAENAEQDQPFTSKTALADSGLGASGLAYSVLSIAMRASAVYARLAKFTAVPLSSQ